MNILLHICCSNCTLFPAKLLRSDGHDFTGFWYNPNIQPLEEYMLRLRSIKKLSEEWRIDMFYTDEYIPEEYLEVIKSVLPPPEADLLEETHRLFQTGEETSSLTDGGERGFPERCKLCYQFRLEKTAAMARENGFEAFSTTLLISPYQDFEHITLSGRELADKYNIRFYEKDFRPYFKEALVLARELGLYRQKYCGCLFSKHEREQAIKAKELARGDLGKK